MGEVIGGKTDGQSAALPTGRFCAPAPASALVLGIGNLLLGDEGVGIRVVEELAARYLLPPEVEALDGGTMGIALLPYLASRRLLLLVDAVRSGEPPATVARREVADPAAFFRDRISPHQLGIAEVLSLAALTNELPGRIVVIGVAPKEMNTGLSLSPEVAATIPVLVNMVAAELAAAGFPLSRRDVAAD